MVEQGLCCETDMDWEWTSQVPEPGFLWQPEIPAACPGACWQRKFRELSTCNVMSITQREEQKGGYWSRLLSLAVFQYPPLFLTLSSLHFYKHQNCPKESKQERVNPLDSNRPQGCQSLPGDGWNKGGCHDNNGATFVPARFLWEGRGNTFHTAIRVFSHLVQEDMYL